ncbi:MAG TPA: hypothetical protein ENJ44_04340 [Oceanospirillales bacterium]|nr:hypothetical protein [Oceanospirillales bacterium]
MDIANTIFILAAAFMGYCLFLVIKLRKKFSVGFVKKYWKYLTILVVIFTLGYIALPFFNQLPVSILRLTVAGVFLFGAVYVFITIKLIKGIVNAFAEYMHIVYKKTQKGEEEIRHRTHNLSREHRFVLIMIDGKATADDIISRSPDQWNPVQCMFEMESQGFISSIDKKPANPTESIIDTSVDNVELFIE